ncbi:hypothetical protein HAX54_019076, partial [Datura stramonium]|nr:hypothetical protein [Datura stramonium]
VPVIPPKAGRDSCGSHNGEEENVEEEKENTLEIRKSNHKDKTIDNREKPPNRQEEPKHVGDKEEEEIQSGEGTEQQQDQNMQRSPNKNLQDIVAHKVAEIEVQVALQQQKREGSDPKKTGEVNSSIKTISKN